MVTGTFYTNSGSGNFTAGPSVTWPSGYTRLEYIEFTGSQYINTGVAPSTTLSTQIEITPNSSYLSEYATFGSTWSASGYFLMFYQNKIRFHSRNYVCDVGSFNTSSRNTLLSISMTTFLQ
jgi:hypothetical protein